MGDAFPLAGFSRRSVATPPEPRRQERGMSRCKAGRYCSSMGIESLNNNCFLSLKATVKTQEHVATPGVRIGDERLLNVLQFHLVRVNIPRR